MTTSPLSQYKPLGKCNLHPDLTMDSPSKLHLRIVHHKMILGDLTDLSKGTMCERSKTGSCIMTI